MYSLQIHPVFHDTSPVQIILSDYYRRIDNLSSCQAKSVQILAVDCAGEQIKGISIWKLPVAKNDSYKKWRSDWLSAITLRQQSLTNPSKN